MISVRFVIFIHLVILFSIPIGHLLAVHAGFKVNGEETLDLCFPHARDLKALLGDGLLNAVGGIKYLLVLTAL